MNQKLRNAFTAFGMESSFGKNKAAYDPFRGSSYIGGMQIGPEVLKKHGLSQVQVLSSDALSREVYMKEVEERTENNGTWKEWDVDGKADKLGIEQGLKEYMTWQQGRGGVIDIITTAAGGKFKRDEKGNPVKDSKGMTQRDRIIANLSTDMRKEIDSSLSDEEVAKIWINLSIKKWDTKKKEGLELYRPDMQEGVMKLNEDIFK